MSDLAAHGARLLGGMLAQTIPMGGGSLSQIVRIRLSDGREAVIKTGPAPVEEAAMLGLLRRAGAPAPEMLAADARALALSVVGHDGSPAWADLGKVLKTLHQTHGQGYGWWADYAFGPVAIVNTSTHDWPAFWAERRLLNNVSFVGGAIARRLETLAKDLPNRLPRTPPASLLHGDLWGGNVLTRTGKVAALIDPACYHGDGLVDVAMLQMFDSPPAAFYAAYGIDPADHAERLVIYRLWPALVHLRLFGSGYRPLVEGLLDTLGV
jgi:fructosamine-3-kinase